MALLINSDCIECAQCEDVCPNDGISRSDGIFVIDSEKCTECVGHFDESQCVAECPADCIVPDPQHAESHEQLQEKHLRLAAEPA